MYFILQQSINKYKKYVDVDDSSVMVSCLHEFLIETIVVEYNSLYDTPDLFVEQPAENQSITGLGDLTLILRL